MGKPKRENLKKTKLLMGALLGMKPKQHEDMKLGKSKRKKARSPARKHAAAKPKG